MFFQFISVILLIFLLVSVSVNIPNNFILKVSHLEIWSPDV